MSPRRVLYAQHNQDALKVAEKTALMGTQSLKPRKRTSTEMCIHCDRHWESSWCYKSSLFSLPEDIELKIILRSLKKVDETPSMPRRWLKLPNTQMKFVCLRPLPPRNKKHFNISYFPLFLSRNGSSTQNLLLISPTTAQRSQAIKSSLPFKRLTWKQIPRLWLLAPVT